MACWMSWEWKGSQPGPEVSRTWVLGTPPCRPCRWPREVLFHSDSLRHSSHIPGHGPNASIHDIVPQYCIPELGLSSRVVGRTSTWNGIYPRLSCLFFALCSSYILQVPSDISSNSYVLNEIPFLFLPLWPTILILDKGQGPGCFTRVYTSFCIYHPITPPYINFYTIVTFLDSSGPDLRVDCPTVSSIVYATGAIHVQSLTQQGRPTLCFDS